MPEMAQCFDRNFRHNGSDNCQKSMILSRIVCSAMRYEEFKSAIHLYLKRHPQGATWGDLRDSLGLPYDRPCPEWTRRLEVEIGLVRRKGPGRKLNWGLSSLMS